MEDEERGKARQLLDEYDRRAEGAKRARNWLIFICIALTITCGVFFQKWQEEKTFRHVAQAFVEYYRQDAAHWQEKYWEVIYQR